MSLSPLTNKFSLQELINPNPSLLALRRWPLFIQHKIRLIMVGHKSLEMGVSVTVVELARGGSATERLPHLVYGYKLLN